MLLFVDGFDHARGVYAPAANGIKHNPFATYGASFGGAGAVVDTGRRSGGCLQAVFYGSIFLQTHIEHLTTSNTVIIGYAMRLTTTPSAYPSDGTSYTVLGRFTEKGPSSELHHIEVRLEQDHTITINRGVSPMTELYQSSVITFVPNVWYYMEVKCTVGASGYVEVRKDTVTVASYTGDTDNGGTTQIIGQVMVWYSPNQNMGYTGIDDYYIADDSGSANNDFLGDVRIDTLFPTGNGTTNNFTPSAGSNYQNVDDPTAPDNDTTYNDGASVGDIDEYAMGDISHNPTTIYGVQLCHTTMRRDGVARVVQARIDGTDVGDPVALQDRFVPFTVISESGWDQTSVNAIVAGIEIVT